MQKRTSHKKLNGQIILKQNALMAKLANLHQDKKITLDELGFPEPTAQKDALQTLLAKSKNITQNNAHELQHIKKAINRKQKQGTFLTGLGITTQTRTDTPPSHQQIAETDPETILRELTTKSCKDDLEELRKMIRETSCNLEGCSRKLNKHKKSIMQVADRYSRQVPLSTLNMLNNYREFESGRLEDEQYYGRW